MKYEFEAIDAAAKYLRETQQAGKRLSPWGETPNATKKKWVVLAKGTLEAAENAIAELKAVLPANFGEVPHVDGFRPLTERDIKGFTDADIAELNAAEEESKWTHRMPVENEEIMRTALEYIKSWAEAYPESACDVPDLKKADKILKAAGISMTAMHWTWGRHITQGIFRYANVVLGLAPDSSD